MGEYIAGRKTLFLAVCLEKALIGRIDLHQQENGIELGYCFHSAYHGKGYASESLTAILDALRKAGAVRVTAGTALNNTPSVRLLERLGFRLAGREQVSFYRDGQGSPFSLRAGCLRRVCT